MALSPADLPVTDTGAKFSRCGIGTAPAPVSRAHVRRQPSFRSIQTLSHALGSVQDPVTLPLTCMMNHYAGSWPVEAKVRGDTVPENIHTLFSSLLLSWSGWAPDLPVPQPGPCLLAAIDPIPPRCFCLALGHVTTKPIMSVRTRFMSSFRLHVRQAEVSPESPPPSFCHKNGLSVLAPCECHKS